MYSQSNLNSKGLFSLTLLENCPSLKSGKIQTTLPQFIILKTFTYGVTSPQLKMEPSGVTSFMDGPKSITYNDEKILHWDPADRVFPRDF